MIDHPRVVLPRITGGARRIGGRVFDFDRRIAVMAIVNRTPDSFFDRGRTFGLEEAVHAALAAEEAGADWIDVGGVKFAPGPEVPADVELGRVLPVVRRIADASDVVISVDTFRADVAAACIAGGAAVVNDTTGLSDPEMLPVVADSDATLVLTHSLAPPRTDYPSPSYADIGGEVTGALARLVERAVEGGVPPERLIVDPGHDLNKNTRQSLELTRRLGEVTTLGLPVLAAVSNKDFVGEALGRDRDARTAGSLAAATACALLGARVLRVHDAAAAVDAARMVEAILGWREPAFEAHNL